MQVEVIIQPELLSEAGGSIGVFDALGNKYFLAKKSLERLQTELSDLPLRIQTHGLNTKGEILKFIETSTRDKVNVLSIK